jgi:hypothetical protein
MNPAEIHPVIAAFPPDQPGPRAVAPRPVIRDGYFQSGFNGFRSGVRVKYMLHIGGCDADQSVGQLECRRVPHLKGGRIVQFCGLLLDRLGDLRAAVPGIAAPQARRAIQHLAPV